MNFLQTSGTGADFVASGERKATADKKPYDAAYRDIYDRNAPRLKREYLPAHLLVWRMFIFDGRNRPHAPPKRRVPVECCRRICRTRWQLIQKNYKIWDNYQVTPDPTDIYKKNHKGKYVAAPVYCALFCRFWGLFSSIHYANKMENPVKSLVPVY